MRETGALFILDSAIEIRVLCTSRRHRGPCGRNEQENLFSVGWSLSNSDL